MTMTHNTSPAPKNIKLFCPERMKSLEATEVGNVGEHLVASILGGYGLEVIKANGKGYDLLVVEGNTSTRIDVKTRSAGGDINFYIGKGKTTAYRDFSNENVDMFAFVCLETLSIIFRPSKDYVGKRTAYVPVSQRDVDPYESWKEAILFLKSSYI